MITRGHMMTFIDLFSSTSIGWNKDTFINAIKLIGVGGGVSIVVWIVRKVFDLGKIIQRLETVEKDIKQVKKEVRAGNQDLARRIDELMLAYAQSSVSVAHSPRQLTDEGLRILKDSGIDSIVDDRYDLIVRKVRESKPENAYQAERAVTDAVRGLTADAAIKDAVEEGAFNSGSFASVVLVVGAIYIRDRVLAELGLKPEEIDKHGPPKQPPKAKK